MGSLGTTELLIILILVLLVFGGAKLPKLARSLGQAQKEFKSGLSEARGRFRRTGRRREPVFRQRHTRRHLQQERRPLRAPHAEDLSV